MTTLSQNAIPTWPVHGAGVAEIGLPAQLVLYDHNGVMSIRPSALRFFLASFLMFTAVNVVFLILSAIGLRRSAGPMYWLGFTFTQIFALFIVAAPYISAIGLSPILSLDSRTRRLSWHAGARDVLLDDVESFELFSGAYEHSLRPAGNTSFYRYTQWRIRMRNETHVVWHAQSRSRRNAAILIDFALAAAIAVERRHVDILQDDSKPEDKRIAFKVQD